MNQADNAAVADGTTLGGFQTATGEAQGEGWLDKTVSDAGLRLVLASMLMLFLELALIRWLGANVVHLAYFSNFILFGSFLGIGAGFLISRKSWSIWSFSLPLLELLAVCALVFPVSVERSGSDVIYFTALYIKGPPAWITLPVIFSLVAVILAGPAELAGRCFSQLPPLRAYRNDLIGSLLGICLFTTLSFLQTPSIVWGIIAISLYIVLTKRDRRLVTALWGLGLLITLLSETMTPGVFWSPYQKLQVTKRDDVAPGVVEIWANGVPHQAIAPARMKMAEGNHIYEAPYLRFPANSLKDVLIVGAGSGSDVAIALSKGAGRVDAVDIDPRILQVGVEMNREKPYADPRVTRHVNDGRAFLESTHRKYDLILFALPDSLTLVNGASQIRLESFLFTKEAMQSVRDHLKPEGAYAMYNSYRENWLIERLAGTASSVFGHNPCVDTYANMQAVISVAVDPANQKCANQWAASPGAPTVAPATDDRPFLYFKGGNFPPIYAVTLLCILVVSLLTVRSLGGPLRDMRPYADLFFMGVAFLLLETKNVATFAMLFGTTWLVNALVFAGVLVIVLAAVETTRKFRTPPQPVVFAGIAASLLLAWVVRPELLLQLSFVPRLIAAVVLAFLPIFLANVAFAKRFQDTGDAQEAFAVNLLGAILGGCLEYSALFLGYNNLLIVTGLLYLAAFLLAPRATRQMV